jgi:hypothetical protein
VLAHASRIYRISFLYDDRADADGIAGAAVLASQVPFAPLPPPVLRLLGRHLHDAFGEGAS